MINIPAFYPICLQRDFFCKVAVTTLVHPRAPPGIPPLKAEKSASMISQDLAFLGLECPCIVIYKLHKCDSIVISGNYPNLPVKCNQLINYATFVLCLLNFLRCKFKTKKRLISSNISRIIKCALISHYPF